MFLQMNIPCSHPPTNGHIMMNEQAYALMEDTSAAHAQNAYEAKCRGIMTAYAQKHGIEPAAYIADNTAYLEKCSVYYRDEKKPQ
jgi:hypothetical protein